MRLKARVFYFFIADDVVAFVWVFADVGFGEIEMGESFLDERAELVFAQVGVRETDVVDMIFHAVKIGEAVDEGARDIADVDVVALEVGFEKDDGTVVDGTIDEIVAKQVEEHAGA